MPFSRSANRPPPRPRPPNDAETRFYSAVFAKLRAQPELQQQLRTNLAQFQARQFLSKSQRRALVDFGWILAANLSLDELEQRLMADDRNGQRLRRFPQLFHGVLSPEELERLHHSG